MASGVMILLDFSDGNAVVRLVPTQQAYDCYMPRVTGDLLMSNRQMLIGGACHEAIHAFWSVADAHRSALLPMVEYV